MNEILELLEKFESKYPTIFHSITLFSDGSGHISIGDEEDPFNTIKQLKEKLQNEIQN